MVEWLTNTAGICCQVVTNTWALHSIEMSLLPMILDLGPLLFIASKS